ncbi:hypothetical protein GH714_039264 [Hevea brasiliensis]|uniref:Uncharacterized protein n=1 Tax=Hevea brasiliensis TaxID=3981 RepID=A0A6A6LWJ8_HEVBR|nr:hypothetical protein GH714_039264 [Hevea brasiliensis]
MDVLAGRKTGGYIDGSISISGYPKKQETFARISGYCEQTDIHSPHVTVYESLLYSAWLRLPPEVDSDTRRCNGLSIEQRKRLTIAVELVANPSIIFMDEPTSGLDARAAAIVMRTLFLLKRGGEEIYVGPVGRHACHLIKYFEEKQGVDQRTKQTFTRFKGSILPNSILTVLLYPVYGLPMEAALVILAKPSILCSETLIHSIHSIDVWDNILESRLQKPVVAIERTVFYRERAAGMYSELPYAFGQVMIELPYILVQTITYGGIVYAMLGFEWTISKFLWYIFIMYFTLAYFTFYGMMTVAITPNHHIAAIVSSFFYGIWNIFSGFIIPRTVTS